VGQPEGGQLGSGKLAATLDIAANCSARIAQKTIFFSMGLLGSLEIGFEKPAQG